jgi:transposase
MTTPPRRIEVITGPERRRRWSREQKQAIVDESLSPRATPAAIARKHGIGTGQLYTWRRQLLRKPPAGTADFAQVALTAGPAVPPGLIEIVLPDRTTVRISAAVDERTLRRVLTVLRSP